MSRNDYIVALGGGVTGDLAGFAAAVYMRGIRFIQIPTTLLAQADSSVGGKTGVNLPAGKNLAGAFHAPSLVICDPDTLDTLPLRHIRNGLAEIIKMAIIGDACLFEFLETHAGTIISPAGRPQLLQALKSACALKCKTVEEDERETGVRIRLNLGHTFAHGIECVAGYRELLHGEAVALGILAAARMAVAMSLCPPTVAERIEKLLERIGLPVHLPHLDRQAILNAISRDKKSRSGVLRLVLPEKIGSVVLVENPDLRLIDRIMMEQIQTRDQCRAP